MTAMTGPSSAYNRDPRVIETWVRRAKAIYIPLPGTGGGIVKANKADFLAAIRECEGPLETEYTLSPSLNIYC